MPIVYILKRVYFEEKVNLYLDTLSVVIFAPHELEDGIHGSPVVEFLFKLMRIT